MNLSWIGCDGLGKDELKVIGLNGFGVLGWADWIGLRSMSWMGLGGLKLDWVGLNGLDGIGLEGFRKLDWMDGVDWVELN